MRLLVDRASFRHRSGVIEVSLRYGRALARLHRTVQNSLADSVAVYYDRSGAVIEDALPVIVEHSVERMDSFNAFEHWTTVSFVIASASKIDRQGKFRINNKDWQIDGIASDDGHVISFYVRQ